MNYVSKTPSDAKTELHAGRVNPDSIRSAYSRYAPLYDATFGTLTHHYQRRLLSRWKGRPGARVLEIGVGTGLTLPLYPSDVTVVGIDMSPAMLARAHIRKTRLDLKNVELYLGDAEHSGLQDESFDCVMLMFVLSVTPNAEDLLSQACRLCRRGGEIFIMNHFSGVTNLRLVERAFARYSRYVGFRSDLPLSIIDTAAAELVSLESLPPFGFFKIAHLRT